MRINEEVKYCHIGKTMETDEKKDLFLNLITNERLRSDLLRTYTSDERKLELLNTFTNDGFKSPIIYSMSESYALKALKYLTNPSVLSNIILAKFQDPEILKKVQLGYIPGYKQLIEEMQSSEESTFLSWMEPTIDPQVKNGLELEVVGLNSYLIKPLKLPNKWYTQKEDSLPNGIEITSPPLFYTNQSFKEIETICKFIHTNNLQTTAECGGHIHSDFTILRNPAVFEMYTYIYRNCEKIIYLIANRAGTLPRNGILRYAMPASENLFLVENQRKFQKRVKDSFHIGSLSITSEHELMLVIEELQNIQKDEQYNQNLATERYFGLNALNIGGKRNTFEYRMLNSEIDPLELLLNFTLIAALHSTAKRLGTKQLTAIEKKFLADLTSENDDVVFAALNTLLFTNPKIKAAFANRYVINSELAKTVDNPLNEVYFASRGGGR